MRIEQSDQTPRSRPETPLAPSAAWIIAVGLLSGVLGYELTLVATRGWYLLPADVTVVGLRDLLGLALPAVTIAALLLALVVTRRYWVRSPH